MSAIRYQLNTGGAPPLPLSCRLLLVISNFLAVSCGSATQLSSYDYSLISGEFAMVMPKAFALAKRNIKNSYLVI